MEDLLEPLPALPGFWEPVRRTAARRAPPAAPRTRPASADAPPPRARRARLAIAPELVERCRDGDPQAFEALFETAKDHVYALALGFTGDPAAAADVTQDVFLKLIDRIGQFRRDAVFTTWLYRVVLNAAIDHGRARRPWLSLADAPAETPELTLPADQERDGDRRRVAGAVRRAVAALRPHLRAPLVLRYGGELSYEEIAAVLDTSAGTVASRLSRAHRQLARKLAHLRHLVSSG